MKRSWFLALVALGGCHVGAGPVFGYAFGRGPLVGWEAGGGSHPYVRGNVGQSLRPSTSELPRRFDDLVSYAVFEPSAGIGGTAGLGYGTKSGFGAVGGLWAGLPWPVDELADVRLKGRESPYDRTRLYLSAAIGWRFSCGVHEIYVAPKIGVSQFVMPFSGG